MCDSVPAQLDTPRPLRGNFELHKEADFLSADGHCKWDSLESFPLNVKWRTHARTLVLAKADKPTVKDLAQVVRAQANVPIENQKIIVGGRQFRPERDGAVLLESFIDKPVLILGAQQAESEQLARASAQHARALPYTERYERFLAMDARRQENHLHMISNLGKGKRASPDQLQNELYSRRSERDGRGPLVIAIGLINTGETCGKKIEDFFRVLLASNCGQCATPCGVIPRVGCEHPDARKRGRGRCPACEAILMEEWIAFGYWWVTVELRFAHLANQREATEARRLELQNARARALMFRSGHGNPALDARYAMSSADAADELARDQPLRVHIFSRRMVRFLRRLKKDYMYLKDYLVVNCDDERQQFKLDFWSINAAIVLFYESAKVRPAQ